MGAREEMIKLFTNNTQQGHMKLDTGHLELFHNMYNQLKKLEKIT